MTMRYALFLIVLVFLGNPLFSSISAYATEMERANYTDFQTIGEDPALVMIAADQPTTGAQRFIDTVARRGIGFLSDASMTLSQQRSAFRTLLRDSFDLDTVARFALGKYWRVATPAQRAEYQRLFERQIVDVYTERFSSYDGQQLKTTVSRKIDETDTLVSSMIVPKNGGEKIKVDWRVRRTGGSYRVVDVVVEGVSMGQTQRSDFASVIQRGGGDIGVLLDHLRKDRVAKGS